MLTNSSTLISEGAARAGFLENFVTSRLATNHLGFLVAREDVKTFDDTEMWGDPVKGVVEVIEIVKEMVCSLLPLALEVTNCVGATTPREGEGRAMALAGH